MGKSSSKASAGSRTAKAIAAQTPTRRRPSAVLVGTAVAIIAIIAVVTGVIVASQSSKPSTAAGNAVPAHAAGMGQGYVDTSSATLVAGAPTVDIYEDFQCPVCGEFESLVGATVRQLADAGKIKLVYHFKTIIDGNYGTSFSLSAANAALCAADAGKFEDYHSVVYANQPSQEGAGWTDAQLEGFAQQAGITGTALTTWTGCFTSGRYDNYVRSTEKASSEKGINSTPTIYINGTEAQLQTVGTPDAFTKAVEAATS